MRYGVLGMVLSILTYACFKIKQSSCGSRRLLGGSVRGESESAVIGKGRNDMRNEVSSISSVSIASADKEGVGIQGSTRGYRHGDKG